MKIINKTYKFLTKNEVKEIFSSAEDSKDQKIETMKFNILEYCNDTKRNYNLIYKKLKAYDRLTKFEIIQLLDLWPISLVCLQLVIEEMEERFNEEELIEILELFKTNE